MNSIYKIKFFLAFFLTFSGFGFLNNAKAQCGSTDFTVSQNVFCIPAIVQFSISNLPAGATVAWDFGNGTLSGNTNPSRLYEFAGNYTVSLSITYVNNTLCVITKPDYIQAKPKPAINVVWDKSLMCFGSDTVTFQDNTPNVKKRDYLIDGTMYSNVSSEFKHLMDSPFGQKSAHIFVEDSFGCKNFQAYDSVLFLFDTLDFDFEKTVSTICMPSSTRFSTLIDTQNHQISSLVWNFPGGSPNTSSSSSPLITYNTGGSYDVSLTVNTIHGCSYSLLKEDFIFGLDSVIPVVNVDKSTACAGEVVTFTMTNNVTNNITWDFGSVNHQKVSQSGNSIKVIFREAGNFGVNVSHNNNGCISYKSFGNLVTINGPVADFTIPVERSCKVPETFKAVFRDISGSSAISQWYWEVKKQPSVIVFTSNTPDSISFVLNERAIYDVKLKVYGSNGCSDSMTITGAIVMDSIVPLISISPQPACAGQSVTISSTSPQGYTGVDNQFEWTLFAKDGTSVLNTDTLSSFLFSFSDTGKYSIKVRMFNNLGCTGTKIFKDTVSIEKPNVSFTITDSLPCRRDSIKLKANFPDNGNFANYSKRWLISHNDSNLTLFYNGDSAAFNLPVPGIYLVKFVSFAPGGLCRDTITVPFRIKVSGTMLNIVADNLVGCNPLTVNWTGNLIRSANYKNGFTAHQYLWKHSLPDDVTFTPPDALSTKAIYRKNGFQRTKLTVNHASGCHDSTNSSMFFVGVKAEVQEGGNKCLKYPIQLTNMSSANSTSFKWSVDSVGAMSFFPSDTSKNPVMKANKTGVFVVRLIAYGDGGCTDTLFRSFRIMNPNSDFMSPDSVQYCAPVFASFTPTPVQFAINYEWHFGDGSTLSTYNPVKVSHFYTQNTDSSGLDIMLVVRTLGCYDTIIKQGYMKIIGPVPLYDFDPKAGCEPLKVTFQNQSKYFSRFYFDYGDGNIIDSTEFKEYNYYVQDKGMNAQVYKTKLLLLDENGCYSSYESPDSIMVRKNAEPNFLISDSIACEPHTVNFINISIFAQDFWWDFDGDGIIDSQEAGPSFTYKAGVYKPVLIAKNGNGCIDTLQKYTIYVNPKPMADFKPEADSVCFDSPLKFTNLSTSSSKIINYFWDFGNPQLVNDTSTQKDPAYSFKMPYLNQVLLVVTDSNNCKDSFNKPVYVYDTIPPVNAGLNYITIVNNKDIYTNWKKTPLGNFYDYSLYKDDAGYTEIYRTQNIVDTSFLVNTGINISNQRYCYVLKVQDSCGNVSEYSQSHCTVELWVEKNTSSSIRLKWLSYVGWPVVHGYVIYKSENSGAFQAIDTVGGNVLEYIDNGLCDKHYCYYVEAIHPNRVWKSTSNQDCEIPDYYFPQTSVSTIRATVTPEKKVLVEWDKYTEMDNLKHYIIDRFNHTSGTMSLAYATAHINSYLDEKVFVNETSYSYYIRPMDDCNYIAPKSIQMRSINLVNKMINYNSNLSWNQYEEWEEGVSKYVVEMESAGGDFFKVGETSPDELSYLFEDINVEENRSVCFRVYAVRKNKSEDTSFSNTYCIIPESQVFIPSAFSPNGDGLNDEFKPRAIYLHNQTGNFIYDYKMYIYNRWGQQVFYSDNLQKGWNGYYKGVICPNDIYIYKINAVGLDGRVFDFKGTVQLLR